MLGRRYCRFERHVSEPVLVVHDDGNWLELVRLKTTRPLLFTLGWMYALLPMRTPLLVENRPPLLRAKDRELSETKTAHHILLFDCMWETS